MTDRWTIATVGGTKVQIHLSCIFLLAWAVGALVVLASVGAVNFASIAFQLVALLLFAMLSILWHEWGHVLVARQRGYHSPEVLLTPVGAISRFPNLPRGSRDELMVALAGPAASLIAALFFLVLAALNRMDAAAVITRPQLTQLLDSIVIINLAITLLNVLPILPLDGGRATRAIFHRYLPLNTATSIVAVGGVVFGAGIFAYFIFVDIFIAALGVFLAWIAWGEYRSSEALALIKVRTAGEALADHYAFLSPTQNLSPVVDKLLAREQRQFPVIHQGRLVGMLSRVDIGRAVNRHQHDVLVKEVMSTPVSVDRDTPLQEALDQMNTQNLDILPVLDRGVVLGVLDQVDAHHSHLEQLAQNDAAGHDDRDLG